MEATGYSETGVDFYQTTRCHIPEDVVSHDTTLVTAYIQTVSADRRLSPLAYSVSVFL